MRNNSGHDVDRNNDGDKTLKDNAGKGGTYREGDFTEGAPFENAHDKEEVGGQRSPSARGRGEVSSTDEVEPDNS